MAGQITAADVRAEIGRRQLHAYVVASAARMHPSRLSQVLNEKVPLTPALGERLRTALQQVRRT